MIHPTAAIGPDVLILGVGVEIGPHASLEGTVVVGHRVKIGAGARIGQDGFGYELEADGTWLPKEHGYGVVLSDDVHIGANSCVDRGSWRPTVIGEGTKIDNLVHVGHNVRTGRNCMIVAGAVLCGSVELEDGAYIAPGALVRERLTVGAGSVVGLGAVVVKNVEPGVTVAGVPARVIGEASGPPAPPKAAAHA